MHALIRNTHVELGKSAQVRLVTLAPVDRTIDDLLLRLGHADGRKRHRLAAGDGNADGGGGGVRAYAAVDVDLGVVVVPAAAATAAHTPPKHSRVIAGGNHHLRLFADGALVEGELVLDQVHDEEEYGAEIDQGAYAGRGQASREYHDDGEQNAFWEIMGVLFVGTSPPPGTIVVDNGGMQLLLLINFGGATPLNPSPNLSLFRISFEFCFPQKGYPRPQKANNVGVVHSAYPQDAH